MMEWWLPYAVLAAALFVTMIPLPAVRRRRGRGRSRARDGDLVATRPPGDLAPSKRARSRSGNGASPPEKTRPEPKIKPVRPKSQRAKPARPQDRRDEQRRAPPPRREPPEAGPGVGPVGEAAVEPPRPVAPAEPRPGASGAYMRDPNALDDWPQAPAVRETLEAFLDRWGVSDLSAAAFRKVEPLRASGGGASERAFAFVVDPLERAGAAPLLVRVCAPHADEERPNRLWVTTYFDHIGERFREDVAKTPQHSRGIIAVRDMPPDGSGRSSVALDYEVPLTGEPYDDIRGDDVGQYRNLLNIMRMFS